MLEFKSTEDLSKLSPDDPAFPIVEDLVKRLITDYVAEGYDYVPEDDGWIVVIEEQDVLAPRLLTELHQVPDRVGRRDEADADDRLAELLDLAGVADVRGVLHASDVA